MKTLEIVAESRDAKRINELRRNGYIPGVVYGPKGKSKALKTAKENFDKTFKEAGESALVNLKIDGKEIGKVLINDHQVNPISGNITHFDLYRVRMDKEIIANIPIKFEGESPAVKNSDGVLVKNHDALEIKCLPGDLIHDLEIDISVLENIDDLIRIKDLKISDKIEILTDEEEVIISVIPPRTEKEMEDLEEKVEEDIEGVEGAKEKKEEDGDEGEEKKDEKGKAGDKEKEDKKQK
ncbi:MAG: 50S ribosomal protein L25 [Patescibacteria group bacterium]|nr:50S ribosomal protein L25 [Patescibacteria group bacterium]